MKNRLLTTTLAGTFLATAIAQANPAYIAETLGDLTLRIDEKEVVYKTGEKFTIKPNSQVCIINGHGFLSILGGDKPIILSTDNQHSSYTTLPKLKDHEVTYSSYLFSIFDKKINGESSTLGVRSGEKTYREQIDLSQHSLLHIETDQWLTNPTRLPIVLELIDPTGNSDELRFESHQIGVTSFIIPKSFLYDKKGYMLKVSNRRKQVLVESPIII